MSERYPRGTTDRSYVVSSPDHELRCGLDQWFLCATMLSLFINIVLAVSVKAIAIDKRINWRRRVKKAVAYRLAGISIFKMGLSDTLSSTLWAPTSRMAISLGEV